MNAPVIAKAKTVRMTYREACRQAVRDALISDPVWELYRYTRARLGGVSTMIERDANIPPLAELVAELGLALRLALEEAA